MEASPWKRCSFRWSCFGPDSMMHYSQVAEQALAQVAAAVLQQWPNCRLFGLQGPMGAGKTTLVKSLAEVLGACSPVRSPTYSLVNEYPLADGGLIYHFDLHRLTSPEEAEALDLYAYFDSGAYCFIEWPQVILDHLRMDVAVIVEISGEANSREISARLLQ